MGDGPAAPLGLGLGGLLCSIAGWVLCAALVAPVAMRRAVDWGPCADCDGETTRGGRVRESPPSYRVG
eukprot:315067-Prymnesium_polylepis.1